ncbi:hypothetical protein [Methylobacterium brachiatum]|uniref:hypothetical protein n=1 Tax=Methylobacterium brachiatum TaxID=269660 RepID=UPI002447A1FC|nr:hypothetical protein [Methylobacterium brachiatum]MDH2308301.1 hypothetical protein [Methylobacterium brachiatum]
MSTLRPSAALALAARLLEAEGFAIVARNERGDSFYLARQGEHATLRLSNHARRPRQRRTHPEVATSLVIREARSAAQIESLIAAAKRNYVLAIAARHAVLTDEVPAEDSPER